MILVLDTEYGISHINYNPVLMTEGVW